MSEQPIRLQDTYKLVLENVSAMNNYDMSVKQAPKSGLVIVRVPNINRAFEVWFKDGNIFKVSCGVVGAAVEADEANRLFQRGFPLGKAVAASVYFPTDPAEQEDFKNVDMIGTPKDANPGIANPDKGSVQ